MIHACLLDDIMTPPKIHGLLTIAEYKSRSQLPDPVRWAGLPWSDRTQEHVRLGSFPAEIALNWIPSGFHPKAAFGTIEFQT